MFTFLKYRMRWCLFACIAFFLIQCTSLKQTKTSLSGGRIQWERIDTIIDERPLDALAEIRIIENRAHTEKDTAALIRCVMYRYEANRIFMEEDSAFEQVMKEVSSAMNTFSAPAKQVLSAYYATILLDYLGEHRYTIQYRTAVDDNKNPDFRMWDVSRFQTEVRKYISISLTEPEILKNAWAERWTDVLDTCEEQRKYRPTLYDVLNHQAILMHYRLPSNQARSPFRLKDYRAFEPIETFTGANFISDDTTDADYCTLRIYQNLCRFHRFDNDKNALLDLERLRFAFADKITIAEKSREYYTNKLRILKEQYRGYEGSTRVTYTLAQILHNNGADEEAVMLCKEAESQFPESIGALDCKYLRSEIERKELQLTCALNITSGKPFPVLLKYRNTDTVFVKIIQVEPETCASFRYDGEQAKKFLLTQKVFFKKEFVTVKRKPYVMQSVELICDPLPEGYYAMLISHQADFTTASVLKAGFFNSTLLGLIQTGEQEFRALDNETGKNKGGVHYVVKRRSYDYVENQYRNVVLKQGTTTGDGIITLNEPPGGYSEVSIELSEGLSHLETTIKLNGYDPESEGTMGGITYFFTDRAIYRPGQTVYYKGIVLDDRGKNQRTLRKNYKTSVVLYDVNGQEQGRQEVTTNEFGSYAGSFVLPTGVLTGQMYITDSGTMQSVYFSVEEYKRPKFEVSMNKFQKAVQLNDSVQISGKATAFAGNPVDGATVKYTVKREFMNYWNRYSTDTKVLATGETTTDVKGGFSVTFKASGIESKEFNSNDLFRFTITADVTDLNGEAHSTQTALWIGEKKIVTGMQMLEVYSNENPVTLIPEIKNLQGEDIRKKVTITIHKTTNSQTILKPRLWEAPDTFLYTKENWHALLPNNCWMNEADENSREAGEEVFHKSLQEKETGMLEIPASGWAPGRYRATLELVDDDGITYTSNKEFTLIAPAIKQMPYAASVFATLYGKGNKNAVFEPGETVNIVLGSSYTDAILRYRIVGASGIIETREMPVSNELKTIPLTVLENHRGGLMVEYILYYDHQSYNGNLRIAVPFTNKDLQVEMQHWNNKMEPGSKEQWTIKISGSKKEKVAAELLASMYDASLDALAQHSMYTWNWEDFYSDLVYFGYGIEGSYEMTLEDERYNKTPKQYLNYEKLWERRQTRRYVAYSRDGVVQGNVAGHAGGARPTRQAEVGQKTDSVHGYSSDDTYSWAFSYGYASGNPDPPKNPSAPVVSPRTNFKETAFFFPQLRTDATGTVSFSFTLPESLTAWKLEAFAHTMQLQSGYTSVVAVAQKKLMVMPNIPRFVRESDEIVFSTKINNLTETTLKGQATLLLQDALTMKPLNGIIMGKPVAMFESKASQSVVVSWRLKIPKGVEAITYTIQATSGNYSDGEQNTLPVLSDRTLVTESVPLSIRAGQKKEYELKTLTRNQSTTQEPYKLTLEFTSNPVWYAVQALPYLMEYPYECAEQTFNRYYSNKLSSFIANSDPNIKKVFKDWKKAAAQKGSESLLSNLQKNQELKQVLLEETPYVLQGKTESEQKQRMALLFDEQAVKDNAASALRKLHEMQFPDGGWGWFKGMPADDYITTYIATGFGKLIKLGVIDEGAEIDRVVPLLDRAMLARYKEYLKTKEKYTFRPNEVQYLYMRSFYPSIIMEAEEKSAMEAFMEEAKKQWTGWNKMQQAMLALAMYRAGDTETSKRILESLRQTSLTTDETGMYWKELNGGYYWYDAPVETQSVIMEAFYEIEKNIHTYNALGQWLLKNKQTNRWESTRATADACYALLIQGKQDFTAKTKVTIELGGMPVNENTVPELSKEAGSGYFKTSWNKESIKKEMGNVHVDMSAEKSGIAWGAIYYQYFDQFENIKGFSNAPLQLERKIYLEKTTLEGTTLQLITDSTVLHTGDKLRVRMEIRCDRPMEYLHLKDLRGSGLEPMNVLSGYRWQDGLGYYESTRDASTNFFISFMPRGNYVLEYGLRVNNAGNFSNGITTLQCMYAPEFVTHSEGIRLRVKE